MSWRPSTSTTALNRPVICVVSASPLASCLTDPNKDLSQIRSVLSGLTNPTEMVSSDKQKSLFVLNNNQIVKLKFVGDEFAIVDNPLSSRVDLKSIYVDYNSLYYDDYICALNKVNRLVCADSDGPLAIPDPFSE